MEMKLREDRYYAVRMLWVHDQKIWDEYQEMAFPILARHKVEVEYWLVTDGTVGEGMDKPDLIVVTSHPSAAAFEAFESDPDYEKANAVRIKGAKLVTVTAQAALLG